MASPQEQQRHRSFEQITAATAFVLQDSDLLQKIGVLGVDYAAINENAFMPNIRRGKIYIPRAHQDTDDLAIIPVLDHEINTGYMTTRKSLQITPTTYALRKELLSRQGHSMRSNPDVSRMLFHMVKLFSRESLRTGPLVGEAMINVFQRRGRRDALEALSRPLLKIRQELVRHQITSVPAITLHEYTHAHDYTTMLEAEQSDQFLSYTELRAYYISRIVQEALGIDGPVLQSSTLVDDKRKESGLVFPFSVPAVPPQLVHWMVANDIIGAGLANYTETLGSSDLGQ